MTYLHAMTYVSESSNKKKWYLRSITKVIEEMNDASYIQVGLSGIIERRDQN